MGITTLNQSPMFSQPAGMRDTGSNELKPVSLTGKEENAMETTTMNLEEVQSFLFMVIRGRGVHQSASSEKIGSHINQFA
mgnify:FL=1